MVPVIQKSTIFDHFSDKNINVIIMENLDMTYFSLIRVSNMVICAITPLIHIPLINSTTLWLPCRVIYATIQLQRKPIKTLHISEKMCSFYKLHGRLGSNILRENYFKKWFPVGATWEFDPHLIGIYWPYIQHLWPLSRR